MWRSRFYELCQKPLFRLVGLKVFASFTFGIPHDWLNKDMKLHAAKIASTSLKDKVEVERIQDVAC